MAPGANPGPDVLADLLVLASEHSAERLVATDRLLRELCGPDVVHEAHLLWTGRLREGMAERDTSGDVFDLLTRLRASSPGRVGRC